MATIIDTTTNANGNIIINVSSSVDDAITLATAGTYSDKNIIFNITMSEELANAVNTALAQAIAGGDFTTNSEFNTHINNSNIHITSEERTKWNNKSDFSGSYNDLSNKPTITTTTLLASNWDSTAKTYSFETDYPNASYDIEVALDSTATAEQAEAFNGAQIVGSAASNTIKAYGDVPTVDIPVILKVVTK